MRKGQRKKGGGGGKTKKKQANISRPKLRFSYGDRVECNGQVGTIVKLWYDTDFADYLIVPYQILLDDGDLVFAPEDDDYFIRKSDSPPFEIEHHEGCHIECMLAHRSEADRLDTMWGDKKWRRGTVVSTDKEWAANRWYPYTIKFDDEEEIRNFIGPAAMIRRAPLRFKLGDRVELLRGPEPLLGTVVRLWAKNDFWEEGGIVPYEVRLDDGELQYTIQDSDDFIKLSDTPPIPVSCFAHGDRVECKRFETEETWYQGTMIQSNEDWAERDCPPFFIRFDDGESEFFYGTCIRASACSPLIPISDALKKLGLSDDDSLFDTPPPMSECPICFLPLPIEDDAYVNKSCCGKTICDGCEQAHRATVETENSCPFCRKSESRPVHETMALIKKRMELNDAENTFCLGCFYEGGMNGLPMDPHKAHQLYVRAAELGSPRACTNAANGYSAGDVVEKDDTKAMYYYEKGAKLGQVKARYTLGEFAAYHGEWDLAHRHYKISACAGFQRALDRIAENYKQGMIGKEVYTDCLRASQQAKANAWSKDRAKAATANAVLQVNT